MPAVTERYVSLPDNTATVYVRLRPAKGRWIVFLHGLGESSLCYAEAFANKALRDFSLLAFDLPGFGRSSDDTSTTNLSRYSPIWERFVALKRSPSQRFPRLFIAGLHSCSVEGRLLLRKHQVPLHVVDTHHWVMIEAPEDVYGRIAERARKW